MLVVYLEVYVVFSLVLTCVLTHCAYGWGGSGMPDTTVEPSGGVGVLKVFWRYMVTRQPQ